MYEAWSQILLIKSLINDKDTASTLTVFTFLKKTTTRHSTIV